MKTKQKWIIGGVAVALLLAVLIGAGANFTGSFKLKKLQKNQTAPAHSDALVDESGLVAPSTSPLTPRIAVETASSLGTTLVLGADQEVYRFTITAGNRDVGIGYLGFDYIAPGVNLGDNWTVKETGEEDVLTDYYFYDDGYMAGLAAWQGGEYITVDANTSKTFSVYLDVYDADPSLNNEQLGIRITNDAECSEDSLQSILDLCGNDTGIIWTVEDPTDTNAIWQNGYEVEGFPMPYLSME